MGSGPSKSTFGVPPNPRVVYFGHLSNSKPNGKGKENDIFQIDAPVLVDMNHGSVRYREEQDTSTSKEAPHEGGSKLEQKKHYFYHARLGKFGSDLNKDNVDCAEMLYVTKGPAIASGKKLYYVYGKGWKAMDGDRVKPTQSAVEGVDFAWPRHPK